MKRALVSLALLVLSTLAHANLGDRAGNGGDPLAADFVARGHFLLGSLKAGADRGLLGAAKLTELETALRTTRIELVDKPLADGIWSAGPDPEAPAHALIRVYRRDWEESLRLNVDVLRHVFKAYLRVIDIDDRDDELTDRLRVTERDFQNRARVSPDCPAGRFEPVSITMQIALDFPGVRAPAYVNGVDYDPGDRTKHRVFRSARLCNTKYHRFDIRIGSFSKSLELFGGEHVTLSVPGGRVDRR